VVDIGANDGTLLSKFHCRTVGCRADRAGPQDQRPAYEEFFTAELAQRILAEHGPAKVITACNVLAHVEDIHDVMEGIQLLLADDGVLVAENHDLASVVDGGQWDTVYHEHLRFYDPYSFSRLLAQHGLGRSWRRSRRMAARSGCSRAGESLTAARASATTTSTAPAGR
jgi:predicted TPR repeat methyltransferase